MIVHNVELIGIDLSKVISAPISWSEDLQDQM